MGEIYAAIRKASKGPPAAPQAGGTEVGKACCHKRVRRSLILFCGKSCGSQSTSRLVQVVQHVTFNDSNRVELPVHIVLSPCLLDYLGRFHFCVRERPKIRNTVIFCIKKRNSRIARQINVLCTVCDELHEAHLYAASCGACSYAFRKNPERFHSILCLLQFYASSSMMGGADHQRRTASAVVSPGS